MGYEKNPRSLARVAAEYCYQTGAGAIEFTTRHSVAAKGTPTSALVNAWRPMPAM